MNFSLNPAMVEATRLTREGRLTEAMALLQTTLGGARSADPAATVEDGTIIELTAERVTFGHSSKGTPPKPRAAAPAGARAISDCRHSGPGGSIDYKLHIPANLHDGAPVIVMLHGCTQSPEDFARGTGMNAHAEKHGLIVAYPAQSRAANSSKCWNWYLPGHQLRGAGEPELIAGLVGDIISRYRADDSRIYIAGLSAGGAAASVMAEAYPDLFAAVGVHSGIACGIARDLPAALRAMKSGGTSKPSSRSRTVPTIIFHGDSDAIVNEANAGEIAKRAALPVAARLRTERTTGKSAGGRNYTCDITFDGDDRSMIERWTVHGAGHAWSGGHAAASYTDPAGPDASAEMIRFFLQHRLGRA